MKCSSCGSSNIQPNGICGVCGSRVSADEYAPPGSVDVEPVRDGSEYGLEPWEMKNWRVSGLSWAAILLACFIPPIGLIVGFFAIGRAKRFRNRPGNKAVAIASVATAFYMGFMILYMGFFIWESASRMDPWDDPYLLQDPPDYLSDPLTNPDLGQDPWQNPDDMKELEKLLQQIQEEANQHQ